LIQIERLRVIHELGYVHNDINLDNILMGLKDPTVLYLTDLGSATKYLNEDGSHKGKKDQATFSGDLLFASLNSCMGKTKSRRDDI